MASTAGIQVKGSILVPARDNKHACFLITDWNEWHKLKFLLNVTKAHLARTHKNIRLPYSFATLPDDERDCEVRVWAKATKKQVEDATKSTALDANFFLSARTYNFASKNGDRVVGVVLKLHKFELI